MSLKFFKINRSPMKTSNPTYVACLLGVWLLLQNFTSNSQTNYKTVVIGTQTWMAENLRQEKFRNGDVIAQAHTELEWDSLNKKGLPAYCYYNFEEKNAALYGPQYNFFAVQDPRGIAPQGWHIATFGEWMNLYDVLGRKEEGTKLKSVAYWKENGNGTNSSGFNALPGGSKNSQLGEYGYWWTATPDTSYIQGSYLFFLGADMNYLDWRTFSWQTPLSVRCVKDRL